MLGNPRKALLGLSGFLLKGTIWGTSKGTTNENEVGNRFPTSCYFLAEKQGFEPRMEFGISLRTRYAFTCPLLPCRFLCMHCSIRTMCVWPLQ